MSHFITILAYKSSGATYRRNCLMDSWDSDFETMLTGDVEEAIKWLGAKKIASHEAAQKSDDGGYEFTVLVDGIDDEFWIDEATEVDEARDAVRSRITRETDAILKAHVDGAKERAARAERARLAGLASAEKRKKQAEADRLRESVDEDTLAANRARLAQLEAELEAGK